MATATTSEIYSAVKSHYSAASTSRTPTGTYETTVARAFGYSPDELSSIPSDANLGLSCGNPLALVALRLGETVLDLGCGAGFDVFLAAPRVGPTGRVVGVDVNKDMLARAERNKGRLGDGRGENMRFVEAPITDIKPVADGSVDCIISNCVVNLVPEEEKPLVFQEMFRLLRPGGRVAISDILIKDGKDLPPHLKSDMALLVGCISGASFVGGYEKYLREAGFGDVLIADNHKDLNVYNADVADGEEGKSCCGTSAPAAKSCCGTSASSPAPAAKSSCGTASTGQASANGAAVVKPDLKSVDLNAYAGSYSVYAVKP